jgi:hypothetical protein
MIGGLVFKVVYRFFAAALASLALVAAFFAFVATF